MSFDWDHSFCLTCDKQTDGHTYCSESCRLAEFEQSSAPSSGPSSPAFAGPRYPWTLAKPTTTANKFVLSPAYDFTSSQSHGTNSQSSHRRGSFAPAHVLSPSSSHSSLCSIKSSSSTTTEASLQLSAKARRELMAYASSFENVRLRRRRSSQS